MDWTKKDVQKNWRENPLDYVSIEQVLLRQSAEILERDEQGIFLLEKVSKTHMLVSENPERGIEWLQRHEPCYMEQIQLFAREHVEYCRNHYDLKEMLICKQAVYTKKQIKRDPWLTIQEADDAQMKVIRAEYHKLTDEELKRIQERHDMYVAILEGEMVGFIGCHLDGSIGLLEVLPQARRRGCGAALEEFMIERTLAKGLIPYGQVETWNEKSFALQKKLGMSLSQGELYWLY